MQSLRPRRWRLTRLSSSCRHYPWEKRLWRHERFLSGLDESVRDASTWLCSPGVWLLGLRFRSMRCRWRIGQHYRLRACADRSWSAGRSALPTVANPTFPDESPNDDDHVGEGYPEIDDLSPTLRAPNQLLMGVMPGT